MLNETSELWKRLKAAEYARMKDIYEKCDEKGLSRYFADSLYYRMIQNPMKQTKSLIGLRESNNPYFSEDNLKKWGVYLEIMLELLPKHEKAGEWKESQRLMEQHKVVQKTLQK